MDEVEFNLEEEYQGDDSWNVQFLRSITSQSCQVLNILFIIDQLTSAYDLRGSINIFFNGT